MSRAVGPSSAATSSPNYPPISASTTCDSQRCALAQAELARRYALHGFCYYHYWFNGRRLLEQPFDAVLRSGEPDLPFALCWANENWTRVWTGGEREVLLRQTYSEEDDLAHIRWLAQAFADPRYVRVNGRPLFLVYRTSSLPDPARTADTWRREASRLGLGDLFLCSVHSNTTARQDPRGIGFDASVGFQPHFGNLTHRLGQGFWARAARRASRSTSAYRVHAIYDYAQFVTDRLADPRPNWPDVPCVTPGFDNSPRRTGGGAVILTGSTPELYGQWLRRVVATLDGNTNGTKLVFVNAWNEWAEGNHLEPCQRWGHAYLEAHAEALDAAR